jgi:hypothetical protein
LIDLSPNLAGPLKNARLLAPLTMAWNDQAMTGAARAFAFASAEVKLSQSLPPSRTT